MAETKTVDLADITKQLESLNAKISALQPGVQKQETRGLTEELGKKPTINYKARVLEALKDTSRDQRVANQIWEEGVPIKEVIPSSDEMKGVQPFSEAIGALSGTAAIPTIWAADVFRCCPYPASAFYNAPFVLWHDDLRKAGGTLNVVTVGRITAGTAGCAEPTSEAPTVAATSISLEEYQCSFYVCRNELEDMVDDTMTELNARLAECIDTVIDQAFIANIRGKGATVDHGTNLIDPAWIAETIGSMRTGTCEPVVMITHPAVEARLMRNSQFVNAATFGDRSVITGGHIIKYLGLDIVVLPVGSLVQNAPGTYHSLFLSRFAVHGARKRDPTIETQYRTDLQRRYVYASVRFGKAAVCSDGVYWLLAAA